MLRRTLSRIHESARSAALQGIRIGVAFLFFGVTCAWGQWSTPQRLLTYSSSGAQDIWITNDGLRLYCQAGFSDIYIITRSHVDSAWGQYALLPPQINEPGDQIAPCESPNGDTLYFCNWSRAQGSSFDVYYSVMTDTGWGPKHDLGAPINTPSHELGMRLSRDGTMMVVSESGDLVYHERQQDGTWGPSIDFGPNVNTWDEDSHVCLSPDNTSLFYYRQGPNSGDIWESRNVNGEWQEAAPLPAPICSVMTREDSPCMLSDGYTFVFRHGPIGDTELYYSVDTTRLAAVVEPPAIPKGGLTSLFPNPFNSSTTLSFELVQTSPVEVVMYDVLGRMVRTQALGVMQAGQHQVGINAGDLASGSYWVRLRANRISEARKVVVVK